MSGQDALVLVIEDEPAMRRFLRASLSSHGFRLVEAGSGAEALQLAGSHAPDLVILDLGLPDADGMDVVRRLRAWSAVPIIVVSARGREEDKVLALDAGADDYLTKPFGVNELTARIRVALRHALRAAGGEPERLIQVGPLEIDVAGHAVRVEGREVHLTPIEFRLLLLLARNVDRVLTHRQILAEIWGPTHTAEPHHVRVHMAELRRKIERETARPRLLRTEPGVGYRLAEPG